VGQGLQNHAAEEKSGDYHDAGETKDIRTCSIRQAVETTYLRHR
jgi:hypothetical protein